MSNDVRGLLHRAAMVPAKDANVPAAWRRGRRMRAQRVAVSGFAVTLLVALGAIALLNGLPNNDKAQPPAASVTTLPVCDTLNSRAPVPAWAESAHPPAALPRALSADGNVLVVNFADPLVAGDPTDRQNKILWIVRLPRGGQPLEITATLPGSDERAVHVSVPANSSPGEIYPSVVNVPAPGCWHFALTWNGHHSSANVGYAAVDTAVPTTTTTTNPARTSTECRTESLTVTLGAPTGAAGHVGFELEFRNHSAATCTMTGFPGVSFLDGSGNQVGDPADRNPVSYQTITLAPGQTGYALVVVTNPDVVNCPNTVPSLIRIYPPNETTPVRIASVSGLRVCVSKTVPGYVDPVVDHSSN
jgi:hypothetical protein